MLKLALIGSGIENSLSPAIFEWLGKKTNTDVQYDLIGFDEISQITQQIQKLKLQEYKGLNITRPYKSDVFQLFPSQGLESIGAINWVDLEENTIANTDLLAIESLLYPHRPRSAVIYGCGGAARAAIVALKNLGCERIELANRSPVLEFCKEMNVQEYQGEEVDWLIQASPETDLTYNLNTLLEKTRIGVFEMVYRPVETPLVKAAKDKSLIVFPGISMLIKQAVFGWSQWTGQDIPEIWEEELRKSLEAKC